MDELMNKMNSLELSDYDIDNLIEISQHDGFDDKESEYFTKLKWMYSLLENYYDCFIIEDIIVIRSLISCYKLYIVFEESRSYLLDSEINNLENELKMFIH